jgi:hypothetical protein
MVSVKGSTRSCVGHAGCRNRRRFDRSHRPGVRKPVPARTARILFSCERTQQVKRSPAVDWLTGVAMLFAAASWGVLAALLGG